MLKGLNNALLEWYRTTDDRQKLQHAYITIFVVSVLVAGVIGLIDSRTGQDMLIISAISGSIYVINGVLWALFESFLLARLSGKRKR